VRLAVPEAFRAVAARLSPDVETVWYTNGRDCPRVVPGAEVLWLDMWRPEEIAAALRAGEQLRWVSCADAGVDSFPLHLFRERGIRLTNGRGLNAPPMAEFVVMAMLAASRDLAALVRAQSRHEWMGPPPPATELAETSALIVGYGETGHAVARLLRAFGVDVTGVRRRPDGAEAHVLGPSDWQARIGDFDWIILCTPLTQQTRHLVGARELAAMKPTAWIFNVARGAVVDQLALEEALLKGRIGGAHMDLTSPEPLPPESRLWDMPNVILTPHSSAESDRFERRAVDLFLDNLARYRAGRPLRNEVDLDAGY
jgi:phosphoglycerate dehydrogenase-like enzyme